MFAQRNMSESARTKASEHLVGGDARLVEALSLQNKLLRLAQILLRFEVDVSAHLEAHKPQAVISFSLLIDQSLAENALQCAQFISELLLLGTVRASQSDHLFLNCEVEGLKVALLGAQEACQAHLFFCLKALSKRFDL